MDTEPRIIEDESVRHCLPDHGWLWSEGQLAWKGISQCTISFKQENIEFNNYANKHHLHPNLVSDIPWR